MPDQQHTHCEHFPLLHSHSWLQAARTKSYGQDDSGFLSAVFQPLINRSVREVAQRKGDEKKNRRVRTSSFGTFHNFWQCKRKYSHSNALRMAMRAELN